MRRGGKPDGPQREIVAALKAAGCRVMIISGCGFGVPDLLACAPGGVPVLLEVKSVRGKVNPEQAAFLADWPGPSAVVRTAEEAINAVCGRRACSRTA